MKKLTHSLCLLTGALALGAGACSSSNNNTPATGAGGNGGGHPGELAISITNTGYAMDSTTGIIGALYAYGDSIGPAADLNGPDTANSDCVKKGGFDASKCSMITSPTPGQPFAADASNKFCVTGTATQVQTGSNGMPDYSDMWGAGMGMDLNNPGGDAGVKADWNGSNYNGMAFDISPGPGAGGLPTAAMRVNFPFTGEHGTDSPYYLGATRANSNLPATGGHVQVKWSDVGGPMYLGGQGVSAPAFDVTKIQSIQFQVFTNTASATPFSFCVSNLAVLTK